MKLSEALKSSALKGKDRPLVHVGQTEFAQVCELLYLSGDGTQGAGMDGQLLQAREGADVGELVG